MIYIIYIIIIDTYYNIIDTIKIKYNKYQILDSKLNMQYIYINMYYILYIYIYVMLTAKLPRTIKYTPMNGLLL